MARTCARWGILAYPELIAIQDRSAWQAAASQLSQQTPIPTTPTTFDDPDQVLPQPDDKGPIFGPTSAPELRRHIKTTNLTIRQQATTAAITQENDGFS